MAKRHYLPLGGVAVFKVHIGYTRNGRNRFKRFATYAGASRFCQTVFAARRVVLTIIKGA